MFIKLRQLVSSLRGHGPQHRPQSFNLSDHEIAQLNALAATEEWPIYLQLIDNVVAYRAEALLTTSNNADLHFLRGQLAAMRELPMLVERMSKGYRDARARPAGSTKSDNRAERRAAALYATPGWSERAERSVGNT